MQLKKSVALASIAASASLLVAGCGSSSTKTSSPTTAGSTGTTAAPISVTSFTRDFSAMSGLRSIAAAGKGKVGVILPDTVSSARYTEFDAPYLTRAFTAAGLSTSDLSVQNAQGSDGTQLTDAQADITAGATVLVVDPLDSGVGGSIEAYAKAHGVAVIDYDRLTLGGSRQYYVSFDNVQVGKLMGNGLISCAGSWGITNPNVVVMKGSPTDNNATLFAQGYDGVLAAKFSSGWTEAAQTAGTWDPPTAQTEFQQAYTAHPNINAALIPNDETAAPIVSYLQSLKIPAKKFPLTGQDATLVGLQNVISGYQCGTVYKPIYEEAQAAAALALYLRASQKPPSALANGTSMDTTANVSVPSVLLNPEWVTTQNLSSTVIADQFVTAAQLCTAQFAADCTTAGINP